MLGINDFGLKLCNHIRSTSTVAQRCDLSKGSTPSDQRVIVQKLVSEVYLQQVDIGGALRHGNGAKKPVSMRDWVRLTCRCR